MNAKLPWLAVLLASTTLVTTTLTYQKDKKMNPEFFTAITQGDIAKVKEMLKADPMTGQVAFGMMQAL
ncbi:MAG: hypothetical protein ACREEM_04380 [Blastocatellia bacterium]